MSAKRCVGALSLSSWRSTASRSSCSADIWMGAASVKTLDALGGVERVVKLGRQNRDWRLP
jgi:hypothetical protein